jgi:hypothetical protein
MKHLSFTITDGRQDNSLTAEQAEFIMYSVAREVVDSQTPWEEIQDHTLADLVAENQDSLVDDVFTATAAIKAADSLFGTDRAAEVMAMIADEED